MKSYTQFIIGTAVISILIMLTLTGCKPKDTTEPKTIKPAEVFPLTVKDDTGKEINLEKKPNRIISLAPSNTEILFALGLEKQVVGVDDYSDYPAAAKEKEKIGGFSTPNIEKIVSLKPDLVLSTGGVQKSVVSKLEEVGAKVFVLDSKKIEDAIDAVRKVGAITGKLSQAEKLSGEMEKALEQVKSQTEILNDEEKPKVFYELYKEPFMSAGQGTFIDDIIQLSGGKNIAAGSKGQYPQFSLETLLHENPDIYLAASGSMSDPGEIKGRSGFENLKAVKEGKVFVIEEHLVNRPGPRIVMGLRKIAEVIHPELFE